MPRSGAAWFLSFLILVPALLFPQAQIPQPGQAQPAAWDWTLSDGCGRLRLARASARPGPVRSTFETQ